MGKVVQLCVLILVALVSVEGGDGGGSGGRGYSRADFPADFIFGSGTSAYQVEGVAKEDGRTPSIFDTYVLDEKWPGGNGNVAVDEYHKYKVYTSSLFALGNADTFPFYAHVHVLDMALSHFDAREYQAWCYFRISCSRTGLVGVNMHVRHDYNRT